MSDVKISMIVAHDRKLGIGVNNTLPWHLPKDFAWFKEKTHGKIIIMGYNTHVSIGKPLPHRLNIIVTNEHYDELSAKYATEPQVAVFRDIAHAVNSAKKLSGYNEEIVIIGGAKLYEIMLPWTDRLYVTLVDDVFECDTFFPNFARHYRWTMASEESHPAEGDKPGFAFRVLERQYE